MNPSRHVGVGMTSLRTRERLVARLQADGIDDFRVLAAIRDVPRHIFVDEALASRAYDDTALPIGFGQTISQPYVVARMSELLLKGARRARVLEIGTGCGYHTAVLAQLVDEVYTIERINALLMQARERFAALSIRNVHARHGDGHIGWPDAAAFDGILLCAACESVPTTLLSQLAPGGRLVAPVGGSQGQQLMCIDRDEQGLNEHHLDPVVFVPLLKGTD